ncbi:MAG: TetR/AcrR family transcriptional regulator [Isosphaeraceae bacterium]
MSKETTRDLLLDTGRRIFLERGFNHTGIESILQSAGVPKGSFYHYFKSKEDFGLHVLNRFASCYNDELERFLGDSSLRPLDRLRKLGDSTCELLESKRCRNGCLVGNLSQEMADQSEAFRARLDEIFRSWSERYATCFREAQEAGDIPLDLDVAELAEFWLNSWQGAVLRAKTLRSAQPLRMFLKVMFQFVLRTTRPKD